MPILNEGGGTQPETRKQEHSILTDDGKCLVIFAQPIQEVFLICEKYLTSIELCGTSITSSNPVKDSLTLMS